MGSYGGVMLLHDQVSELWFQKPTIALATEHRLPTIAEVRSFAHQGGLLAFGPNIPDLYRRGAFYVDRILKGAKPADLPVEQPTKFDFVINLQTAQALGLTISQSLLQQSTEVIQ
ncbi:MAG TPA: ABC transporter substrate binding protein [Chloroflexota bacterium]|nr:ABC transporter substrate binding protein [Chloroflexota bacterium]